MEFSIRKHRKEYASLISKHITKSKDRNGRNISIIDLEKDGSGVLHFDKDNKIYGDFRYGHYLQRIYIDKNGKRYIYNEQ